MASANFHSLQPGPECETISHSALPPPAKSVVSIGVWDTSFVAKQLRIVLSGPMNSLCATFHLPLTQAQHYSLTFTRSVVRPRTG
jgi:hypothetical protein